MTRTKRGGWKRSSVGRGMANAANVLRGGSSSSSVNNSRDSSSRNHHSSSRPNSTDGSAIAYLEDDRGSAEEPRMLNFSDSLLLTGKILAYNEMLLEQKISLRDQVTMQLFSQPCRALGCKHLQCFDYSWYIMSNQRKARYSYTCPICEQTSNPSKVYVDAVTLCMLEIVKANSHIKDACSVCVNIDGTFQLGNSKSSSNNAASLPGNASNGSHDDRIVIDLCDDDSDNENNASSSSAHASIMNGRSNDNCSSSSGVAVPKLKLEQNNEDNVRNINEASSRSIATARIPELHCIMRHVNAPKDSHGVIRMMSLDQLTHVNVLDVLQLINVDSNWGLSSINFLNDYQKQKLKDRRPFTCSNVNELLHEIFTVGYISKSNITMLVNQFAEVFRDRLSMFSKYINENSVFKNVVANAQCTSQLLLDFQKRKEGSNGKSSTVDNDVNSNPSAQHSETISGNRSSVRSVDSSSNNNNSNQGRRDIDSQKDNDGNRMNVKEPVKYAITEMNTPHINKLPSSLCIPPERGRKRLIIAIEGDSNGGIFDLKKPRRHYHLTTDEEDSCEKNSCVLTKRRRSDNDVEDAEKKTKRSNLSDDYSIDRNLNSNLQHLNVESGYCDSTEVDGDGIMQDPSDEETESNSCIRQLVNKADALLGQDQTPFVKQPSVQSTSRRRVPGAVRTADSNEQTASDSVERLVLKRARAGLPDGVFIPRDQDMPIIYNSKQPLRREESKKKFKRANRNATQPGRKVPQPRTGLGSSNTQVPSSSQMVVQEMNQQSSQRLQVPIEQVPHMKTRQVVSPLQDSSSVVSHQRSSHSEQLPGLQQLPIRSSQQEAAIVSKHTVQYQTHKTPQSVSILPTTQNKTTEAPLELLPRQTSNQQSNQNAPQPPVPVSQEQEQQVVSSSSHPIATSRLTTTVAQQAMNQSKQPPNRQTAPQPPIPSSTQQRPPPVPQQPPQQSPRPPASNQFSQRPPEPPAKDVASQRPVPLPSQQLANVKASTQQSAQYAQPANRQTAPQPPIPSSTQQRPPPVPQQPPQQSPRPPASNQFSQRPPEPPAKDTSEDSAAQLILNDFLTE